MTIKQSDRHVPVELARRSIHQHLLDAQVSWDLTDAEMLQILNEAHQIVIWRLLRSERQES